MHEYAAVFLKAFPQQAGIATVGLDQDQLPWDGSPKDEIRNRPDPGSRFNCSLADPPREGIDDPLVIVCRFGNRFELGTGV